MVETIGGLLFFGTGLLFAIQALVVGPTQGIMVNDVRHRDWPTILGVVAFAMIFVGAGAYVIAKSAVARVIVDARGIRVFDAWNRPAFDASWSDVAAFRYVRKAAKTGEGEWHLVSTDRDVRLPAVAERAELLREVVTRIPRGRIAGDGQRPKQDLPVEEVRDGRFREAKVLYVLFFSAVWFGFLALIAGIAVFASVSSPANLGGAAVFAVAIFGFGALMAPIARDGWRRYRRGHWSVTREGMAIDDGTTAAEIAWRDLVLVEEVVSRGEDVSYDLVLVGRHAATQITAPLAVYDLARAYALAVAPEDVVFAGFGGPGAARPTGS
jgi:hypothetical protein